MRIARKVSQNYEDGRQNAKNWTGREPLAGSGEGVFPGAYTNEPAKRRMVFLDMSVTCKMKSDEFRSPLEMRNSFGSWLTKVSRTEAEGKSRFLGQKPPSE